MSRCLVVYFSQGGTTTQVAERIATGLRAAQWQVDLCNLRDERPRDLSSYDLLGVGSPVYIFRPAFNVTGYVKSLPDLEGLPTFAFLTHGTYRGDAGTMLRRALRRKGGAEVGYFHCLGADYFLGYLKRGHLFSPDHPAQDELAEAERFGQQVSDRVAGQPYVPPKEDSPPGIIYRLERLSSARWLTSQIWSRFFTVNAKECNDCGLCIRLCPTGNISKAQDGSLVFGRGCLLCLTCEMKCPSDAVTSPLSWPLFAPFIMYNVHRALRDPSLDHVRVSHERGRTRLLD